MIHEGHEEFTRMHRIDRMHGYSNGRTLPEAAGRHPVHPVHPCEFFVLFVSFVAFVDQILTAKSGGTAR
jgi:hypothetical protein